MGCVALKKEETSQRALFHLLLAKCLFLMNKKQMQSVINHEVPGIKTNICSVTECFIRYVFNFPTRKNDLIEDYAVTPEFISIM